MTGASEERRHHARTGSQKESLQFRNTVTEMKNAFDGPISRLEVAEEICE